MTWEKGPGSTAQEKAKPSPAQHAHQVAWARGARRVCADPPEGAAGSQVSPLRMPALCSSGGECPHRLFLLNSAAK